MLRVKGNPTRVNQETPLSELVNEGDGVCHVATCLENPYSQNSNISARPEGLLDKRKGEFLEENPPNELKEISGTGMLRIHKAAKYADKTITQKQATQILSEMNVDIPRQIPSDQKLNNTLLEMTDGGKKQPLSPSQIDEFTRKAQELE